MLTPHSESEAEQIIRDHAQSSTPLAIIGGNTRSGLGNPVTAQATLSSRSLSGIIDYNPAEMVMTAKAGTPLAEVEAALMQARQTLAFEPMDHRPIMGTQGQPTIGGVFAANVSGPRRFVAGAARDSLLGIRFINGTGEAIKAGGRVMKNVTGLDLVKLLCGSRGTLGFLTEVTFRVLPLPPTQTTLVISGLDEAQATLALAAAMATSVEVSGAAHLPENVRPRFLDGTLPDGAATILRLEGLLASVDARSAKLRSILQPLGAISQLPEDDSRRLWREVRDALPYAVSRGKLLWRVSLAPSKGHQLVAALRLQAGIDAYYDWQGGLVWMQMEEDGEQEILRHYVRQLGGGHATLMRPGAAGRGGIAGLEPLNPIEAALSRRIKQKLDPHNIFNPGKMEI